MLKSSNIHAWISSVVTKQDFLYQAHDVYMARQNIDRPLTDKFVTYDIISSTIREETPVFSVSKGTVAQSAEYESTQVVDKIVRVNVFNDFDDGEEILHRLYGDYQYDSDVKATLPQSTALLRLLNIQDTTYLDDTQWVNRYTADYSFVDMVTTVSIDSDGIIDTVTMGFEFTNDDGLTLSLTETASKE